MRDPYLHLVLLAKMSEAKKLLALYGGWCLACVPKINSGKAPSANVQALLIAGIHSEASPQRNGCLGPD